MEYKEYNPALKFAVVTYEIDEEKGEATEMVKNAKVYADSFVGNMSSSAIATDTAILSYYTQLRLLVKWSK